MKYDVGCDLLEHNMWMGVSNYNVWFRAPKKSQKTYGKFIEDLHLILKEVLETEGAQITQNTQITENQINKGDKV